MSLPAQTSARAPHLIAVVDEDAPLLNAIRFSLEAEGYSVLTFKDGEGLLDADRLEEIACFVVDHRLPALDGRRVIRELRRRGATGRVVMITTRPQADVREACWDMGIPIVEKPLLGESLNACIRGLLAGRGGRAVG
ncbi:MAG TPA: response regulator [Caulobacteraceae bacterium]